MTDNIVNLLTAVKNDVGAVRKGDRNDSQGFNFRGVDAVVNAVSPALLAHGIMVGSNVREVTRTTVEVGRNRTPMGHVALIVDYVFHGPAGDSLAFSAAGEAMDSGDKATPKAMSVAYRTALLQALSLPTDEPDPDGTSYERHDPAPLNAAIERVKAAWSANHGGEVDLNALGSHFIQCHNGAPIQRADADTLNAYAERLEAK